MYTVHVKHWTFYCAVCLSARHAQFSQKAEIFGLLLSLLTAGDKEVKILGTRLLMLGFDWVIGAESCPENVPPNFEFMSGSDIPDYIRWFLNS